MAVPRPPCTELIFPDDVAGRFDMYPCAGIPPEKRVIVIENHAGRRFHYCANLLDLFRVISVAEQYGQVQCSLTTSQQEKIRERFDLYARAYPDDAHVVQVLQTLELRRSEREVWGEQALPVGMPKLTRS